MGRRFPVSTVKQEGVAHRINQQLMAIVCTTPGAQGKTYLSGSDYQKYVPDEEDLQKRLEKLRLDEELTTPDEPLPNYGVLGFRVQPYGLLKWSDLFTTRQLLSLMTFVKWVKLAHQEMLQQGYEEELGKAIATYLALTADKISDYSSSLSRWGNDDEGIANTYSRQALPMVWDFAETNPLAMVLEMWTTLLTGFYNLSIEKSSDNNFYCEATTHLINGNTF